MSDAAQQWGVLGFNKDGQLALPGFPEGFSNGLTLQAWVLPRHVGGRWKLLELGGGRERGGLVLGAGDAPGSLELRMEDPQGRASLSAPGVLMEGRWSHISATIDAQGLAVLYVQGVQAASGLLRPPGALEWSSGFVGRSEREHGFEGELSQLSIWRSVLEPESVASQWRRTLRGDEPGLAAYYPLGSVVEGQVLELSPSQRHARVSGPVESRSSTALAEAVADVPFAARFPGSGGALQLPPLTPEVLQDGLSFQAWIRPRRADSLAYLLELGAGSGKENLVLRGEKGSDALVIEERCRAVVHKGGPIPQVEVKMQTTKVCKVPGVLVPERWIHVSAALDAKKKQCTVYINGREAYQGAMDVRFFGSKQVRTHCYIGRSSKDASATFAGDLAEVRLWRGPLSPEHVAKTWLSRLRGDERELLGCYRLDALENGLAIDTSFRRMHARVWSPVTAAPAEALPLRSVIREGQASVGVQGRLLTDWVPLTAFPKDRKLEEAKAILEAVEHLPGMDSIAKKELQRANAVGYGSIQGSLVRCSVYEVVIEPRNAAGEPVARGQVELSFDRRVEVLRTEDGQVCIESWPARAPRKLAVPDTARLRLRVLAGSKLDCPAVRVRCEGMPVDAWVVARPAEASQEALQSLDGAEMRSPRDGRPAVFDKDTSSKDADATADLLRATARALPLRPVGGGMIKPMPKPGKGGSTTKGLSLGDVGDVVDEGWREVEQGAGELADLAERTVKHASDLVVDGYDELKKLVEKAAKTTLQVGADAARKCIRAAKKLAIDTGDALEGSGESVWGVVQIVGTTVVNGSEQAFRVMVSGVNEAIEAIEEIARKVGATLRKIIDFLSMLFQWDRFLKNMERIYRVGEDMLRRTEGNLGALKNLGETIEKFVQAPAGSSLAKKTVGQVIGIEKCPSIPGMDELNYLIDQMESAFSSVGLSVDKHESKERTAPSDVDQQGADSTQEKSMGALPSELFASTQSPLAVPMKVLLELPAEVWSFSSPVCDPVLKWIEREAVDSLKDAKALLTGRLSVPVLTELIETVVLGGGKLNLLRLVALVGSIPMTLTHSSRGKSTKSLEQGSQQKATGKDQEEDTDEALQWLLFSISLVNALLIGARAVFEQAKGGKKVDTAIRVLYGVSGAFALASASADLYLASKFKTQKARDYGYAHGVFGLAQGVWLCVMAGVRGMNGVEAIDAAIEIVLGLAELGTTIGAVAEGASESEELGGTGFRLSNWTLKALQKVFDGADNYTGTNKILSAISGSAKVLSVGTCGLMAAVDISEAIYTAHGHAS